LILSLSLLVACASKPTDETIRATTVVGTVGEEKVTYDELYYLAKNYLESAKLTVGDNSEALQDELDRLIREHIPANFAMLALCEEVDLDYKKSSLKKDAKAEIDSFITAYFGGDRDLFEESLTEAGLTERYLRYTKEVDLMYGRLLTHYPDTGRVESTEKELRAYIQKNFVRTVHVMNPSLEEINTVHKKLSSGEVTMFDAIGSVYNKDFSSVSGNGNYFTKGSMEKPYEEAAYTLAEGQISAVVSSMGEVNGIWMPCYYIIQRLPMEEAYIDSHLSELQYEYYGSVIATDLESVRGRLSFSPNEFYEALNLAELPAPEETSALPWILLGIGAWIVAMIVLVCVLVIRAKKRHAKKNVGTLAKRSGR
jgi:hypothetical protein